MWTWRRYRSLGAIACQRILGGVHAITDFVGSCDLHPAYAAIFARLRSTATVEVIGMSTIEIYQTTRIVQRHRLAQVSIAIPVKSRPGSSVAGHRGGRG